MHLILSSYPKGNVYRMKLTNLWIRDLINSDRNECASHWQSYRWYRISFHTNGACYWKKKWKAHREYPWEPIDVHPTMKSFHTTNGTSGKIIHAEWSEPTEWMKGLTLSAYILKSANLCYGETPERLYIKADQRNLKI